MERLIALKHTHTHTPLKLLQLGSDSLVLHVCPLPAYLSSKSFLCNCFLKKIKENTMRLKKALVRNSVLYVLLCEMGWQNVMEFHVAV